MATRWSSTECTFSSIRSSKGLERFLYRGEWRLYPSDGQIRWQICTFGSIFVAGPGTLLTEWTLGGAFHVENQLLQVWDLDLLSGRSKPLNFRFAEIRRQNTK
jgi:hypothetical protein